MKKEKGIVAITIGIICIILAFVMTVQLRTVKETDITLIENMREDELKEQAEVWKQKYEETQSKIDEDNKKINDTNIDEIIFIVNNRLNNRLQDRLLSFNLAISLLPKSVLPKAANNTKYSTKVVTKLNSPIWSTPKIRLTYGIVIIGKAMFEIFKSILYRKFFFIDIS